MSQILTGIFAFFLVACSHDKKQRKLSLNILPKESPIPATYQAKKDTVFWYKEVPQDSSLKSDFRIIYNDYKLYFDKKEISAYCDSIIKLNDDRTKQCLNIKREVNHLTNILYSDNDFIILTTFRPKIINKRTKEYGKSLIIQFYKDECDDVRANFYVATKNGERVKLNRLDLPRCIT
jgi:hypothetical protein